MPGSATLIGRTRRASRGGLAYRGAEENEMQGKFDQFSRNSEILPPRCAESRIDLVAGDHGVPQGGSLCIEAGWTVTAAQDISEG